jgi:hypothetical protein
VAKKTAKKSAKKTTPAAASKSGVSPIVSSNTEDSTSNQGGRPSLYDKHKHPAQAFALTGKLGAEVDQVAEVLGVATSTVYNWMNDHPEFLEAINKGRELDDNINVEGTLLKRALGYTVDENTFEYQEVLDQDGKPSSEREKVLIKTVTKEVLPDVKALTTWLCNRMPDRWRPMGLKNGNDAEKAIRELMGKKERMVVDLSQLSRADAESLRAIIKKQSVGTRALSAGTGTDS